MPELGRGCGRGWPRRGAAPILGAVTPLQQLCQRNLDLLQSLDLLDRYGPQLDLAVDFEIMRAFDGELAEGGR